MNGLSVTLCVAAVDANLVPKHLGYQKITGLSAVKTLTVPAGATCALIAVEDSDIRWRDDGGVPTATDGMPIAAGQDRFYNGDLSAFQLIEQSASATVHVTYYSQP